MRLIGSNLWLPYSSVLYTIYYHLRRLLELLEDHVEKNRENTLSHDEEAK